MTMDLKGLGPDQLTEMYRHLLYPRLIEEKMLILLRQGKISKWFSGIGQEAIAVGATLALEPNEWIMPLHRNLGVFTARNLPLSRLYMQWQGMQGGYSKGRERSFHFGSPEHYICGMISHLGPQLAVADGVALAYRLKEVPRVVLAFSGEGGTSEGDFHEALNLAAVWDLPVIFLVENNGYALSTPVQEQYRCISIADKARGYGIEGVTIDGNDLLAVYDTIKGVREYCIRYRKPYLVECMTFRMRGHEEASGTRYVPEELLALWAQKDPVLQYEQLLLNKKIITEDILQATRQLLKQQIDEELAKAEQGSLLMIDAAEELQSVYAAPGITGLPTDTVGMPATERRFVEAIREGLVQSLEKDKDLVVMGQDIAEYGGAFKVTEGLVTIFGKQRIRNTPICESAVVGAALGLCLEGKKAVVEMQFADFVSMGFNQVVNNLAKIHYRWAQAANVVIRMPTGAGVGAGPFHSQSNEAWFMHTPGLKVVYPSTPADAKGLLMAAIEDPNPVLFFEHKALYRSISGRVPDKPYVVEIGKARQVRRGQDIAVITYGMGVIWAEDFAAAHPEISIEILDLRSLLPLDYEAIRTSVKRTGRVLVLHEDTLTAGVGAEIAAWIGEHCFPMLDAPVLRCASLDTPVPFNKELEKNFLAKQRLGQSIEELMGY
ncbi:alpha-ketoacid dehydrogenase subunit alpha/beta [Niabella drilacis]|uniref:2-oxoisovalerate dehydrogenase E1 component n=1 Tax=Niabella drilacis (strain DSM 25811 / CCM 8410 / CCUG 62505 / LMG 26954 / E90) TaxID=1285928 RepID=A0A1G7B4G8_NIADE|nr:dehydrogenase E1 component subunit alpha/beta [Niabella drilacis]SDE21921.1 2-oxoisovalerate dehydrogenase E1 component [Niabella drilacis]